MSKHLFVPIFPPGTCCGLCLQSATQQTQDVVSCLSTHLCLMPLKSHRLPPTRRQMISSGCWKGLGVYTTPPFPWAPMASLGVSGWAISMATGTRASSSSLPCFLQAQDGTTGGSAETLLWDSTSVHPTKSSQPSVKGQTCPAQQSSLNVLTAGRQNIRCTNQSGLIYSGAGRGVDTMGNTMLETCLISMRIHECALKAILGQAPALVAHNSCWAPGHSLAQIEQCTAGMLDSHFLVSAIFLGSLPVGGHDPMVNDEQARLLPVFGSLHELLQALALQLPCKWI